MSAYGQALKSASTDVGELSKLTNGLTLQQTINALSTKSLTKEKMAEILVNNGINKSEAEAIAAKIASTQANGVATFSLEGYTAAIWANVKAIGAWMLSNPVGWVIGLGAALAGATVVIDLLSESIEEQKEKLNDLREEYSSIKDELKSLNDQITENDKAIQELQDKKDDGTISLIDEDQLRKLKLQNELLEQKYKVEKDIADLKKSELANENKETFYNEYQGSVEESADYNFDIGDFYSPGISDYKQAPDKNLVLLANENKIRLEEAILSGDKDLVKLLEDDRKLISEELAKRSDGMLLGLLEYQNTLAELMNDDGTFDDPTNQKAWNDIESWKKSIYESSNRSGEWNTIQIEAAMDDNSLQEVQAKLKNQMDNGTLTEIDITHYTGLHEALEKANLILEKGQTPASVYLKYLRSIAASQQDVNSTVPGFSFNDDNATLIDNYQSQINDLNAAFGQISDGSMTPSGLLDLLQAFPELTTRTDDLSSAIQELIENKLKVLKDELRDQGASEEILALFDNVTESTRNINLGNVLSGLSEIHSSIENVKKEYEETKKISVETLQEITSKYPNLTNAVHLYLQGKINEQQLINELQTQYQTDLSNYESYMIEKRKIDDDFYDDIVSNLSDDLLDKANTYGIDLSKYANYTAAKLGLDAEYAKMRDEMLEVEEPPVNKYAFYKELDVGLPIDQDKIQKDLQEQKNKELNDFSKFVEEFNSAAQEIINDFDPVLNFTPTGGGSGSGGGGGGGTKDDSKAEIDWLDQSLKNLQREADRLETTFDNTKGIKNQITALKNLNDALGDLRDGYQDAADEYDERYTAALAKIPAQNREQIQSLIESGEKFNIFPYSGEDTKIAEAIQEAIDAYNGKKDSEDKVAELNQTIDDNKGLEKYKLYQEYYEGYLDVVNEQLNDQTLTVDEKNALLDKQYYVQKKINDTLRKQAEYENDLLTISKLNQEDENNEKQKYLDKLQNNKEQNQVYIDTYDTLLEDDSLTKSETKSLLKSKKGSTDRDYRYKFKEIIATIGDDTWNNYIQNLKEQYGQTKMDDSKFIKKHINEIASYFDYTGMLQLLSEYYTSNDEYDQSLYDTDENNRIYKINKRNNKITDIQHDIDLKNGNGTEEEYSTMRDLHEKNKNTWKNQLSAAKDVLANTEKNTKEWDEANAKVQELENNIYDCDKGIQECNVSILQLSLKDIEDSLENVNDKLDDINEQVSDYDTYISAANIVLDEQIEFQESQKKIVQDQIDALQKEHDLRESNLNVQKASWNLEKIKNQKTNKVFKEGKGFVFESDADEVNNAQHELDEAIYNNKISLLQNQIDTYDEEIDRLNDIKESFNNIKSDIEDMIVLSKALVYDADFVNKVLSGDIDLIDTFKNGYQELLTNKDLYENEQKVLSDAQAEIEDIIEDYKDGSISIEQAQALINNVVSESTLSIDAYKQEMKAIQETAQKELEELETTKKTSENKVSTTNESNEAILQSYNSLYDNLSVVFGNLNTIMEDFVTKTQTMASSVSKSLASIKVAMNAISGIDNSLSSTIPTVSDNVSSNYKKVSDDIAKQYANIGSALIGASLATGIKVGAVKTPTVTTNNSSKTNLSFNGDIIVNSTGDVNALSKDIVAQLPGAMLQTIFKNK